MTVTARGVAWFSGVILGAFGLLGLLVSRSGSGESTYLLASWLLPITLFPAAALAASLDGEAPRTLGGQATVLWPAYVGLVIYAAVTGNHWLEASARGPHEPFAALFMFVVMSVHATVFLAGGLLLAIFAKTRPAGFQMWLAYPLLLGVWLAGGFLL